MRFLIKIFRTNSYFFAPFILVIIIVLVPLVTCSKFTSHIYINNHHNAFLDFFFKYITNLGDGLFAVIIGVLLLFFSFRKAFFILTAYISGGLVVQLLKRFVFPGTLRPVKYFEGIQNLHLIDGEKMKSYMSFPSGHSTTAFGLFLCFAFISGNNFIKFSCLVAAVLVAFSRVYLSQHFLVDVYFGSLTGVAFSLIMYRFVYLSPVKWMDKNFLNLTDKYKKQ